MNNCQIIDQLQIPKVLLHSFKRAFECTPCFYGRHGVCLIKKCIFLRKRHKISRKTGIGFSIVTVIPACLWFYCRPCFVFLIRFTNETPLSRFYVRGNFLIVSRSSLFTDWSQAGLNILMKLKRAKQYLKNSMKNDAFALQQLKLFQSYRQGDRKNHCPSAGTNKKHISWQ